MKNLLYVYLIVFGFVLHKFVYEIANYRVTLAYTQCINNVIDKPWITGEKSPGIYCFNKLKYNKVEQVLLYQPEFYCNLDPFACQH